jgi:hypothetical protein
MPVGRIIEATPRHPGLDVHQRRTAIAALMIAGNGELGHALAWNV